MSRKILFIFFVFALIAVCFNGAFAQQDNDSSGDRKTVTISEEQFRQLLEKVDSLQSQVNNLSRELEAVKAEKTLSPATDHDVEEKPDEPDDAELLRQLQAEMEMTPETDQAKPSTAVGDTKMNPDITVTGDFVWNINHDKKLDGGSPFNLREIGVEFQSNIDPWSRAFIALGAHQTDDGFDFDIEEAYIDYHRMPFGSNLRAGKFFVPFGKDNVLHQHDRPYVDVPNVIENFLEPGNLPGTGAMVSTIVPTGNVFTEVTGAVVNDESSRSFTGGKSGKPLYLGRVRSYLDINDSSNVEVGYSHLRGYNNEDASRLSRINGIDVTYRWRPLLREKYNSMLLRGEYLWSRRNNADRVVNSSGYYGLAQYQLNRNWYVGGRYDYSEFPNLINAHEKAHSAFVTYAPTEFAFYRLQYKDTARNYAPDYKQLMFQINFMMGPHGAHNF